MSASHPELPRAPPPARRPRRRAVLLALAVFALVAGGLTLVGARGELEEIARAIARGDLRWILLAAVLQAGFFLAMAVAFERAARLVGGRLPFARLALLSASLPFVNLFFPTGGLAGAIHEARHFERMGLARPRAILAVAAEFVLFWASFFVVFFLGLTFLATRASLAREHLLVVGIGLGLFFGLAFVTFTVLTDPDRLLAWAEPITRLRERLRLKRDDAPSLVEEVVAAVKLLEAEWKHLASPFLASLAAWAFEVLSLFAIFLAFGHAVHPGVLVAGYALGVFLGKILPIPGGLGVVDASMAATFVGLAVPVPIAIAVVLVHRGLALWLPVVVGGIAFRALERRPVVPTR